MKFRRIAIGMCLALMFGLMAGCGASSTSTGTGQDASASSSALNTAYTNALSVENQLVLGTLELEGTDKAVTPDQATRLLPLWQALRGVLSGGNPAQAEVDALLKQIESSMTSEQVAAIRAMQLTQESLVAWAQSNGLPVGGGFGSGNGGDGGGFSPELRATIQAARESGADIPPDAQATLDALRVQGGGGQGFGPRGTISPELRATFEAGGGPGGFGLRGTISPEQWATFEAGGGRGGGFRIGGENIALLNRLIETLTARAPGAAATP